MFHRLGAPFIRQVLADFRAGRLTWSQACAQLELSRSQFYAHYHSYLEACAQAPEALWTPGGSGGDHAPDWPVEVQALLRKRLSSHPPASYSFAASEALRLHQFRLDRAQVRHWAIVEGLAHRQPPPGPPMAFKRWQCARVGELWQLDATPHAWFTPSKTLWPMLNMLDDCSRLFVGSHIYEREILPAYLDFLPRAFREHGLPLVLYVDYHSLFFTHMPESLTQLGQALGFYGVSFKYAPTPQAKGKIERAHLYWQSRLPAYFASEHIRELATANAHVEQLRQHHNEHETHRELQMTPRRAHQVAVQEQRSLLRPAPVCPWWPYVWSVRTSIKIAPDGRVPVGTHRQRVSAPPGSRAILCHHPSGHYSVLAQAPNVQAKPQLLFSNLPKPPSS